MRIVIDTNVLVSGIFFGDQPRRVLEAVWRDRVVAYATPDILGEYAEVEAELLRRGQGHLDRSALDLITSRLEVIAPKTQVSVCRDPDDDKFIGCALDAKAIYIVSGDKDLLTLGKYAVVEMVTAAEFMRCLSD